VHLFDRALQADYDFEPVYGILASEASEGSTGERSESVGVSDNDRKYYSLERAREVLDYEPQDNSAEWDGTERVDADD
jgi:NAD+ dependent glucose-6-phosphate dehydrogenase